MKKILTIIVLVLALAGFAGVNGAYASPANDDTAKGITGWDFSAGDRPSPYPPYHRSDR